MSALDQLHTKISDGSAVVGIYGLGYVGLPLALRFAEVGIRVIGFDIDDSKVQALNAGRSYIERLGDELIASARKAGFEATGDFSRSTEADALIICVPTPLNTHHEPDLSFVIDTTEAILPYFREGQLLSLESTTWPGTTEEELAPRLERCGFKAGSNCALVFSPEREDPGNAHYDTRTIPKVIGGMTPRCLELGQAIYGHAINTLVPVSSPRAAEMTKLLENIHRAVNIGLVNEMKIVSDKMGIDIHEVIRAAATKPFGFVPYTPGPGLGGHCIPIDPFYLTWKAKEYGVNTRFIELAGEINHYMPHWVVEKVADALNSQKKAVNGSRVLILGLAYKKNIDDTRESPAVEIMSLLEQRGALVAYSDPHVPTFPRKRDYSFDLDSVQLSGGNIQEFDCVVLATDHDLFDYEALARHSRLLVDTRGRYAPSRAANIIPA
ncbi:nucleotide sugar dehydrogenase [Pseudomonas nicosulfuronedens]|uniref:Nucleotide sugar dehydrogenase n=1 Tax=Pseudomonas nicosulfuronedens TaxID=2571105 RepID=A0A5R9R8L8_9PSED|nr:nucleotide sugar dehydrogenase [Pseudomonas nicosulfuronedens]MDH1007819.1 nucleotide sugar dehydrogenase [Pseudomonas nicosulfuronedens]MDH1982537.1 nucleotide sugar dehydrogenase [Pseudomonas nicosulfuronedens]MDH2024930.1 nucleotide sugar dehydrogenase [Pseudomonas nicosulfuronedens]TLX79302.1 nucleotide sugar dehydrogenase [Pseudomonas nicosulfuronedens]